MDQLLTPPGSVPATNLLTPPPAPLAMPTQNLRRSSADRKPAPTRLRTSAIRLLVFGGAVVLTALATDQMVRAVAVGEVTVLQGVLVAFFAATFGWIALSMTSALAGLLPQTAAPRRAAAPEGGRCVLAMPVYNEDPAAVTAGLYAMATDLARSANAARYEIFVLSDTTDPDVWSRETAAVARLRHALRGTIEVWYRHRHRNLDRKAGNIRDFVERWGARYETMLVLDADSLMSGDTIRALEERMAADPDLGLVQTVPTLIGRTSLFARLQQFAGRVYGPVVARGLAAWQGDDGNYWGHNAMLRTRAFAACCGLPHLPGRRPFGGSILSHDFVEAALLRRAGWKVRLATDLGGSWEASPPSLLDAAARDRRWAQGNIQHLGVIGARGLKWPSRAHLALGVMSYLSSPLWLGMILVGLALTVQSFLLRPRYFTEAFQLFPTWPRFDSERMIWLFVLTMGALLVPKIIGLIRALTLKEFVRGPGDALRLLAGWVAEVVASALFAPTMMLIQSRHVWEILSGSDAGWRLQRRDDGSISLREAVRRHAGHTFFGLAVVAAILPLATPVLAWLAPVLAGWLASVPLSIASGSNAVGSALASAGLLVIPEEREAPPLLAEAEAWRRAAAHDLAPLSIERLLDDPRAAGAHFRLAGQRWAVDRGHPDVDCLTLRAKLADAATRDEALGWLTAAERMRLLGDRPAFDALCRLPRPEIDDASPAR